MSQPIVSFAQVSKYYRGASSYRSLRDDIAGLFTGRTKRLEVEALREITLEILPGESVGVIGRNGAGKTTFLKLMCRIAFPSRGKITVGGRVGALIEVGTGMHPELSGRENVDLYGRIMGLSRRDVQRRFGEIVEFAAIGESIDRPVKQYSSGMQLRLGFSIAAHLDPDIFVVDEAIAVGDAGFQAQCADRMMELSRAGRTLIFVSHDLAAVESLCGRALLLKAGHLSADGPAHEVVEAYFNDLASERTTPAIESEIRGGGLSLLAVGIVDDRGNITSEAPADRATRIRIHYRTDRHIPGAIFSIGLSEGSWSCFVVASMVTTGESRDLRPGEGKIDCVLHGLPLTPRSYEIWGSVRSAAGYGDIVDWQRLSAFKVLREEPELKGAFMTAMHAPVRIPHHWEPRER
jgi:lipopolysaccharide transport system ATP-binding protein